MFKEALMEEFYDLISTMSAENTANLFFNYHGTQLIDNDFMEFVRNVLE